MEQSWSGPFEPDLPVVGHPSMEIIHVGLALLVRDVMGVESWTFTWPGMGKECVFILNQKTWRVSLLINASRGSKCSTVFAFNFNIFQGHNWQCCPSGILLLLRATSSIFMTASAVEVSSQIESKSLSATTHGHGPPQRVGTKNIKPRL